MFVDGRTLQYKLKGLSQTPDFDDFFKAILENRVILSDLALPTFDSH